MEYSVRRIKTNKMKQIVCFMEISKQAIQDVQGALDSVEKVPDKKLDTRYLAKIRVLDRVQ